MFLSSDRIDKHGAAWFIEANTKPGKKVIEQAGTSEDYRKSLVLPLYYAGYVMGTLPDSRI
ncbi:YheC/YheD family protein [Paenibacillus sp. R14(2021)]|uniref:YheC/YheD family protein n=1 Tax=Paenibacillus sp. R14(2021) TaxID=2859228 RepID=UPI0035BE40A8